MSPDLRFWQALGVTAAAAVLLGLAVRTCRRARARRTPRDRITWQPGEKAAFRRIRRLYPHLTAAGPDGAEREEWWPW